MHNRNCYSPILIAVALSLSLGPSLLGATDALPTKAVAPAAPERPSTYTVLAGDTLWDLSQKFKCTVKQLRTLNSLKKDALKPGQVLKIPPVKSVASTPPPPPPKAKPVISVKPAATPPQPKTTSYHPTYPHAQPVQDFDIPASTFASCPTPPDSSASEPETTPATSSTPEPMVTETPAPSTRDTAALTGSIAPVPSPKRFDSESTAKSESVPLPPASKLANRDPLITSPSSEWANRFFQVARDLGNRGIDYNDSWRPPGESHSWDMDCSNTSRYIYKAATGIQLPRTASDQYYYLHLQNKAWDVPQASNGFADCNFLRQNLKAGDLLFWENTYKPERQPPITHVMVFLGKNNKGEWVMAGSQTGRGGEHNRSHGGPDIYVFDPTRPCGGYSTWMGLVHHQGRFCAYGRPLEADKSKLAMAAND